MVESGRAPSPGPSPEPDALALPPPTAAAEKPPESRAGGERMEAAEEGRRARLRQVSLRVAPVPPETGRERIGACVTSSWMSSKATQPGYVMTIPSSVAASLLALPQGLP